MTKNNTTLGYSGLIHEAVDKFYGMHNEMHSYRVSKVIRQHAALSALAGGATAALPATGAAIGLGVHIGSVYAMYIRMSKEMGIKLKGNVLKTLGSVMIGNIAGNLAGYIVASFASLVPVGGSIVATVSVAGANYASAVVCGMCYGKAIVSLTRRGKKVSDLSEEELKNAINSEFKKTDFKEAVKKYGAEYDRAHGCKGKVVLV